MKISWPCVEQTTTTIACSHETSRWAWERINAKARICNIDIFALPRASWYKLETQQILEKGARAFGEGNFRCTLVLQKPCCDKNPDTRMRSRMTWSTRPEEFSQWPTLDPTPTAVSGSSHMPLSPPLISSEQLGPCSWNSWSYLISCSRYTVFGKVIDGWDTLDELERIPVNPKNHRPLKGVEATINAVTIHANPMAGWFVKDIHFVPKYPFSILCISDRMDFLFKDRGSGKRTIKPSKDSESLEACMAAEESDDSDFEVFEKQRVENSLCPLMISSSWCWWSHHHGGCYCCYARMGQCLKFENFFEKLQTIGRMLLVVEIKTFEKDRCCMAIWLSLNDKRNSA